MVRRFSTASRQVMKLIAAIISVPPTTTQMSTG